MARDPGAARRIGGQAARRAFGIRGVRDVLGELNRVTWPSKEETLRLSLMVIAVSAAVGAFLGVIDLGFGRVMTFLLGN